MKKYFLLCLHLKFKYFNFCEIFSQQKQSDFFLEPRGHFTRFKKYSQGGRPIALSSLREDRPQYILKIRIIELQPSFRLQRFFAGTLRKWRLISLLGYFSLARDSVGYWGKTWMKIRHKATICLKKRSSSRLGRGAWRSSGFCVGGFWGVSVGLAVWMQFLQSYIVSLMFQV